MKTSLQYRLSASISLAVVAIAAIAAASAFLTALKEAHIAQDKQLSQTAHIVIRIQARPITLAVRQRISGIRLEERIVVRLLHDPDVGDISAQNGPPLFSNRLPDGFQTVEVGTESWRTFVMTDADGVRIAVAQQTTVRNAMAVRSAVRSLISFALLAPVLVFLVRFLIQQLLGPLRKLAVETGQRRSDDLGQLDPVGLPDEIQPFISEINRLLIRIDRSMQAQRRFVADAAHELRSPLTAMNLQAERLMAADMSSEARQRLLALTDGLKRNRVMLDQLLALARSQQGTHDPKARVSLQQTIRLVIEDLYPLAEEREIDLGVVGSDDAAIGIHPIELQMLIKNLVDNAIRYSPRGGRVDVLVVPDEQVVSLIVDDTGPGIAGAERERVFDPFYRILGNGRESGSGLGLAIVRAVADKSGATVSLMHPPAHQGLRVVVRFNR